jgi:glutamate dehydrogenase/leucine dehydrogenase
VLVESFASVAEAAKRYRTNARIAAYCVAMERVAYCLKMRGLYA